MTDFSKLYDNAETKAQKILIDLHCQIQNGGFEQAFDGRIDNHALSHLDETMKKALENVSPPAGQARKPAIFATEGLMSLLNVAHRLACQRAWNALDHLDTTYFSLITDDHIKYAYSILPLA